MKKLSYLLIINLFCFSLVSAQDTEKPYFVKTYQSSDVGMVNVRTSGGGISVTGQTGSEARVEVYVKPNNWNGKAYDKEEIEERLKDYTLSIKKEGNTIFCIAKRKTESGWNDWKKALNISFKIYTPEKVSTDLQTSGGGISIKNVSGNQDFTTSGGGLKVRNVSGNIKGRTSGGGIEVFGCRDNIDLSTSGGGIEAEDCKGDVRLSTSGGGLRLKGLDGKIKATTSGGGVRAENIKGDFVTSTSGGSIRLSDMYASVKASTSGGVIDADIRQLGSYLSLSTSAGSIHVRMPLDKGMDLDLDGNRVHLPTLKNFSGSVDKDRVKGKLNGGGVLVSMDANSGGITINE
jgi:Putative adhesin